jgi:hypothetical protein
MVSSLHPFEGLDPIFGRRLAHIRNCLQQEIPGDQQFLLGQVHDHIRDAMAASETQQANLPPTAKQGHPLGHRGVGMCWNHRVGSREKVLSDYQLPFQPGAFPGVGLRLDPLLQCGDLTGQRGDHILIGRTLFDLPARIISRVNSCPMISTSGGKIWFPCA